MRRDSDSGISHFLFYRFEMNLHLLHVVVTVFATLVAGAQTTVDHDKIEAFPQPAPITVSEKAAIKFKPQLHVVDFLCEPFPAVNAAGEVSGGLKGTGTNDACKYSPMLTQVYGRAGWYKDMWAIMYAWYFPKGFNWLDLPSRRHDWKNVVVWIDNPDLETPKIVGVAMSKSDTEYRKEEQLYKSNFAGVYAVNTHKKPYDPSSNTNLRFLFKTTHLGFADWDGRYQDLIMWEQLTDAARVALNNSESFGGAEVPFSDENFEDHLDKAWPL